MSFSEEIYLRFAPFWKYQQPHLRAQGLKPPHACEKGIAPNDWQENLGPVLQQGSLSSRGRGGNAQVVLRKKFDNLLLHYISI